MEEARRTEALPDLVPVRMLNEFVYCPRLAYLEWVQGEFQDNADTVEGRYRHRTVDRGGGALPPEPPSGDEESETLHARSVLLSGPAVGLIARIDLVEATGSRATPVDYKRGKAPDIPEGAYEPERVQLCAQGLILRENGFECDEGVLYFVGSKTRVRVPFDAALVERTRRAVEELREVAGRGKIPPPLVDSPKCPRCSLVAICLPDEVNLLAAENGREEPRRLIPARQDGLPLHVTEQGAIVGKSGETIEVRAHGRTIATARLMEVSQVSLYGNIQVTAQLQRELSERGTPVCHFSYGGWFSAMTTGLTHKNVELRRRQFAAAEDPAQSIRLARQFVDGKIKNARTLLRRNSEVRPDRALRELARLRRQVRSCVVTESLLGLEGAAARTYFAQFTGMIRTRARESFDFKDRNRRPPRDPVNALLSFVYALLVRETTVAVLGAGFDPFMGFYHRPRYGRPALGLDLAEEFRPLVGDSVVLTALNNGEVQESDFIHSAVGVGLTPRGRRRLIGAYERRMDSMITHPVFGYAITYRQAMAVQARLLARHLAGETPSYVPFCTR